MEFALSKFSSKCLLFLGRSGGGPAFAFSKFIREFDVDSMIICSEDNELIDIYKIAFGDRIITVKMPVSKLKIALNSFNLLLRLLRLSLNFREIHITAYHPIFIILIPFLRILQRDIFYVLHDVISHKKNFLEELMQFILRIFKVKIIVISNNQATAFYLKYKKMPFLETHPPYLHYEYYKNKNKKSLHHVPFLILGRLEEYKGLMLMRDLESVLTLLNDQPVLRIAGKGKVPQYLINKPHIEIINKYIPDEDIPSLLMACDYVVLPYISATQSGLFKLAETFNKNILATPLDVFKEQANEVHVNVYFSKYLTKDSFHSLLKEHFRYE